jgi:hypothetical protein
MRTVAAAALGKASACLNRLEQEEEGLDDDDI